MRPNQRRAWEALPGSLRPRGPPAGHLDLSSPGRFAGSGRGVSAAMRQLIVEIGPGAGESLVPMAEARPQANVLAFEVYQPAIARMLAQLARTASTMSGSSRRMPWPPWSICCQPDRSTRSGCSFLIPGTSRAIISAGLLTPEFAALAASRLKPGGIWRIATDWAGYADRMREVLDSDPSFANVHPNGWAPRWAGRPITHFEQRGTGRGTSDLRPCLSPCRLSRPKPSKVRWRLDIGYDGTNFSGWAAQAGRRTVQGELERWMTRVLRLDEPAQLVCAGRTDAGVHARGQVAHVDLDPTGDHRRRECADPAAQQSAGRGLRGAPDLGGPARIRRPVRGDLAALCLPAERCRRTAGSAVPLSDCPGACPKSILLG